MVREYLATACDFETRLVPDEAPLIAAAIRALAAAGCALVCTTGGTGPAARDVTPEAMAQARIPPACAPSKALIPQREWERESEVAQREREREIKVAERERERERRGVGGEAVRAL